MKISKFNMYSTDMCQSCQVTIVCVKKKKALAACCNNQDETNTHRELSCDIYFAG